jgi:tetratricopeptide (TPR) repeat protein
MVGREAELALLRSLAQEPGVTIVHGPPGVGKTALAREALRGVGVFVQAAPRDTEARLARRLLHTLRLPELGPMRAPERLEAVIAARPDAVLVVDGADDARAGVTALARRLGDRGARVVLIARALLPACDRRLPLTPFVVPEEPSALRESAAFRAWSALVRRVRPRYRVDDAELSLVAAILRRLDGLPIAMALVAPRMTALDHRALLRELDDESAGRRVGPLASIRRLLASSWATLPEAEREILRLAVLFPGPFDAERVCDVAAPRRPAAVHGALQALVDRSWIAADPDAEGRLWVLGVVRDFVYAAAPAKMRTAERTFFHRYAALAARWNEAAERRFAIAPIRDHARELYCALEFAERSKDLRRSVALIGALSHLLQIGRAPPGLADRVTVALARARSRDARARLLYARLLLARSVEQAAMVTRLAGAILRTRARDRFVRGAALHARGSIAIESGAESAAVDLDAARRIFSGWTSEESLVITHRAIVEQRRGNVAGAIALLREAVAIARHHDNPRAIAIATSVLGAVLAEHGSRVESTALLREAIALAAATEDLRTEAYARVCRGASLLATSDAEGAAGCFRRAMELFRDVGSTAYEAFARQELGIALAEVGDRGAARAELERAIAQLGTSGYAAAALGTAHLAFLDWEDGLVDVARDRLDRLGPAPGGFAGVVAIARALFDGRMSADAPKTVDERIALRRVEALLRRAGKVDVEVEVDGSAFRVGAKTVDLTAKPALRSVLGVLASARGATVSAADVVKGAWPGEKLRPAAALNRLYVAIRRLRELGLDGVIENVAGGYRLVPSAKVVAALAK